MKNKFLIGTITVFTGIIFNIIFFNFFNSSKQQQNNFHRKFSKIECLSFNNNYKKLNRNSKFIFNVPSTNSIMEFENQNISGSFWNSNIYKTDLSFLNNKNLTVCLPSYSEILNINNEILLFSNKSKICVYNIRNKEFELEIFNNFQIFSLTNLKNLENKYLCFGEILENNVFKTGFFIIDIKSKVIKPTKIIKTKFNSTFMESRLQYTGLFQNMNPSIYSFTFNRWSKIYFFKSDGLFENEINTKDGTLLPKIIIKDETEYSYSRDGLGNSSAGIFLNKNYIYVFSMASEFDSEIIIDKYSFLKNKYIESYKLKYKNYNSTDITNVVIDINNIVITFNFDYASFTFSRYI